MAIFLALIAAVILGMVLGVLWRGTVLIGDQRTLNRLASQLTAEQVMQARTHATLRAMRDAAFGSWRGGCE